MDISNIVKKESRSGDYWSFLKPWIGTNLVAVILAAIFSGMIVLFLAGLVIDGIGLIQLPQVFCFGPLSVLLFGSRTPIYFISIYHEAGVLTATAIAGLYGLCVGCVLGAAQFFVLRGFIWIPGRWVLFTTLGWGTGSFLAAATISVFDFGNLLVLNTALFDVARNSGAFAVYASAAVFVGSMGVFSGLFSSIFTIPIIRRNFDKTKTWVILSTLGWGVGGFVGGIIPSIGGLILGSFLAIAITGIELSRMMVNRGIFAQKFYQQEQSHKIY